MKRYPFDEKARRHINMGRQEQGARYLEEVWQQLRLAGEEIAQDDWKIDNSKYFDMGPRK